MLFCSEHMDQLANGGAWGQVLMTMDCKLYRSTMMVYYFEPTVYSETNYMEDFISET